MSGIVPPGGVKGTSPLGAEYIAAVLLERDSSTPVAAPADWRHLVADVESVKRAVEELHRLQEWAHLRMNLGSDLGSAKHQ